MLQSYEDHKSVNYFLLQVPLLKQGFIVIINKFINKEIYILSSKGIEPFTALTNSFTENHHYQSDHLPLYYLIYFYLETLLNLFFFESTWT